MFDGTDVYEHIFAAALRLNEPVTLGRIEPLHSAGSHAGLLWESNRNSVVSSIGNSKSEAGLPGRCPPQGDDLLAQDQILSFKRCSRSKQANKRPPKQSAKIPHRKPRSPDSPLLASRIRFAVGTADRQVA